MYLAGVVWFAYLAGAYDGNAAHKLTQCFLIFF